MPKDCVIVKENVSTNFSSGDLTTDCYYVHHDQGIDLVRGSMVKIFDDFYDRGLTISRIQHAQGSLNPKLNSPRV